MKYFNHAVVTVYLCLLASCKPEKIKYYYINNMEVKNSVSFKEGSYFVYRDSAFSTLDSFWIYHTQSNMYDVKQSTHTSAPLYAESIIYFLMNKDSVKGLVRSMACKTDGCDQYEIGGCIDFRICVRDCLYRTSFPIGYREESNVGYIVFQQLYNSIIINGVNYNDVYRILHKEVNTFNWQDSIEYISYYSLTDGILKYTIKTDSSYHAWEIQNKNIIH